MIRRLLLVCLACATATAAAEDTIVDKLADGFDGSPWVTDLYDTAIGAVASEVLPTGGEGARAMAWTITYPAKGFAFASVAPPSPLVVPGDLREVTLSWRGDGSGYPLILNFADALDRGEVDGAKLEWNFGDSGSREWRTATFTVPTQWLRPLRIRAISSHNWSQQDRAATVAVAFDALRVRTDLAPIDPATGELRAWTGDPAKKPKPTPLLSVDVGSGVEGEVFAGIAPAYALTVRSWLPGTRRGALAWTLYERSDGVDGAAVAKGDAAISVDSVGTWPIAFPPRLPLGLYRLAATLSWADGGAIERSITAAVIDAPRVLDAATVDASPWGIDTHGGRDQVLRALTAIGVRWYRDYAWSYNWMVKAKGDGRYDGWPWYPKMMARYEALDARVLPILVDAIIPPKPGGAIGPDATWRREIAAIVAAFPTIRAWELDNEYEGSWKTNDDDEQANGDWKNYRAFHRALGEVVAAVGGGTSLAVEQGTAGIRCDLTAEGMAAGDYAAIDVLNCHHYCGVDAPERNVANENTGGDGAEEPELFGDRLRRLDALATSDGKQRQMWLTEFGWDTRAGKVVSERHQAAYLQRGYLTALASGCDKAFWFWDLDGDAAKTFFDGCGLFTVDRQPKPATVAYAAMTRFLAAPRLRGELDAGDGTTGYLFADGDRLVAAVWSISGENGPEVAFASGELRDWRGNPLAGRRARLGLHPTWCVGVAETDAWAAQAAWSIDSPRLVTVAAGDPVELKLRVRNAATAAVRATASAAGPDGWKSGDAWNAEVPAGGESATTVRIDVPETLTPGEHEIAAEVALGKAKPHRLRVRVLVRPALAVRVAPLGNMPGAVEVTAVVRNRSRRAIAGTIALTLPQGWQAPKTSIALAELAPGESATVPIPLTWTATWQPTETAQLTIASPGGASASAPLIPGAWSIPRLAAPKLDADFAEWPAAARMPAWMLATDAHDPGAIIRLAWSDAGLVLGLEVADSKLIVDDPASFWDADAIELFVSGAGAIDDDHPWGAGERQLWLVPRPATTSVYAGQWKRHDEIPATRTDIGEVRGCSVARGGGYALEALIPAALLPGFSAKPGASIGLVFSLVAHGATLDRSVAWPAAKSGWNVERPKTWGRIRLAE